ncbi:MAG TPA: hypothetical protein VD763_10260 [Candidatus Saccharimonadales bacterium]|nr:hypothetical protein [Candidatus Saccharimonadales bacterium]
MPEILTESFCERCGTRYTFESAAPKTARLKGLKVVSRGLKNFVMSDDTSMDEAFAAARSETDREVTSQQLDAFHKTFNFCMTCRQYTCGNCWNEVEGRCLSCAPSLGQEILPAPFPDLAADGGVAAAAGEHGTNGHDPDRNGHAPATEPGLAWPTSDLMRGADEPLTDVEAATTDDLEPIDAAARLAFLAATDAAAAEGEAEAEDGLDDVAPAAAAEGAEPVDADAVDAGVAATVDVDEGPAVAEPRVPRLSFLTRKSTRTSQPAADAAEVAAAAAATGEAEVVAAGPTGEAEVATAGPAATEPEAAAAPEVAAEAATGGSPAEGDLAAATAQVADEPATVEPDDVGGRAAAASAQTAALFRRFRPGQSLDDELEAFERSQAATALPDDSSSGRDVAALAAAAALATDPEAAPEPTPEPEPAAEAPTPVAASADAPVAEAPREDLVQQPTWQIVAPDSEPSPDGDPTQPAMPAAASAEPQWPTQPEWRTDRPQGAGLPFLGRPSTPTGTLESLWAESAREVSTASAAPTERAATGVQPCVSCGLSLSATARFCRRCGTRQG